MIFSESDPRPWGRGGGASASMDFNFFAPMYLGGILYSCFLKRLYYSEQQRRIVLQVQDNILCDNWTNVILEICFHVITDMTEHFRNYFLEIRKDFRT